MLRIAEVYPDGEVGYAKLERKPERLGDHCEVYSRTVHLETLFISYLIKEEVIFLLP